MGNLFKDLPASWGVAELAEICHINPTVDKSVIQNDMAVSFVPMSAVQAGTGVIDISETREFGRVQKGYTPFAQGDVLFAKITPCMENGKMAVVPAVRNGLGFGSTEFHVLRPRAGINGHYLYYYVSSEGFRREAEHNMSGAVGQRRVTTPYLSACPMPVPPADEQGRIVARIEELFSELEDGIATLKKAREQLKVYRQALLKHAFEGKLTAQWRADNPDKLETAEALRQQIQVEREECFRQQLEAWNAAGRQGSKPKAAKPVLALTADELSELPELPTGWVWVRLGELAWSVKDGPHFSPKYVEAGVPFISGGNIRSDGIDFSKAKYVSRELHEELSKRCKPEKGDVLYTKGGTTGIARVNTYDQDFNVWVHVAVLKITEAVLPFYLQHVLNSPFCYSQSQKYTHGVGNQDLGLTRMVNIVVAMCSLKEQTEVVDVLDDRLSMIQEIDRTLVSSLRQAEALRQSILKKAFSGQLVPQDPADEPASRLLERLRAERTAALATSRPLRGRKAAA